MSPFIALLSGINLGKPRVKLDRRARCFEELHFTGVATFIASGNVIFSSPSSDGRKLARQIEPPLATPLGDDVDPFVRTRAEVAAVAALSPFAPGRPARSRHHLHVSFLAAALTSEQQRGLEACRPDADEFRFVGRNYDWLCRRIKPPRFEDLELARTESAQALLLVDA